MINLICFMELILLLNKVERAVLNCWSKLLMNMMLQIR